MLVSLAEYNEVAAHSRAGTSTWSEDAACVEGVMVDVAVVDVVWLVEADRMSAPVALATQRVSRPRLSRQ